MKKRKIITASALIVFLVGFAFGAYMVAKTYLTAKHEEQTFNSLVRIIENTDEINEETGTLRCYDPLYDLNSDFFGWLKIDDTKINYPVMYTPDDTEYYLHRDFYGYYSESGCLFIDGDCPRNGNHYLIYGHHMNNGSMFGELPKYCDEAYFREHRTVFFDTRYERRDYEVVAAFYAKIYDKKDEEGHFCYYNCKDLTDPAAFDEYISGVRSNAIYDTGVVPAYGDELLTLSTCNYHTEDGRFVVVARKAKEEKKE